MRFAHFAVEFGLGHQRRHRVHYQHVNRAGTDQRFGDFQRLLARIRLRNQQVVDINAQFLGIPRIQRVLGIHKRRQPAVPLRLGDDLKRNRRLARRLRPENFNDAAARNARPHPAPRQS